MVTCAAETACPLAGNACMHGSVRRAAAHVVGWYLLLVFPKVGGSTFWHTAQRTCA